MSDRTALIETPSGAMQTIIAEPRASGPFPVAIMYPHVGGLTQTMRLMAGRCAEGGYLCVAPDLYHRLGTIVLDPQSHDETAVAIRRLAASSLTPDGVMSDTRALLTWLDDLALARRGPRGTIGYGAGGGFSLRAAATFPDEIAACASVLGFGFVTENSNSPHLLFPRIRAEIYCAFAEHDDVIPPTVPERLAAELKALPNIVSELVIHPGTRHPYAFPDRAVYDRAAETDWTKIFAMFSRRLSAAD
jgi:carboxymethylenebutenolidase